MTYKLNWQKQNYTTSNDVRIVFTLDLDGNFKSIDAVGEQILGYRHLELRRTNLGQLVAPEFVEYVRQQIVRAGLGDFGAVYEVEVIAKDGSKVRLEISTRLVMRAGCPFELEGIALVREPIRAARPRCLDDHFTLISAVELHRALTFASPGNKP